MNNVCNACPRQCSALRLMKSGDGFCRKGYLPEISYAGLHQWEEPCISGGLGSGTVFFTGCSLQCVYCQNYLISNIDSRGKVFTPEELSNLFFRLINLGADNINLVNPTHFVDSIIKALQIKPLPVPVIYNTGGYETVETIKKLEGMIDIYLTDFKYADENISLKYSNARNYPSVAKKALNEMLKQTSKIKYSDNGLLQRGTIIRHLILPGHTQNSIDVIDYLKDLKHQYNFLISLMAQYVPNGLVGKNRYPEINRKLTKREYNKVENHLLNYEFNGYVQELSSAKREYIPDFTSRSLI